MPRPIVIVDADAGTRGLCSASLRNGRVAEIVELEAAEAAWELCRREPVACLLIGEALSDGSGLELLSRLAGEESLPRLPTIFVLSGSDPAREAEARNRGAQECLRKAECDGPLPARLVDAAIERHQLRVALRAAEEKFRALLDLSTEPVTITRLSDDRFVEVNPPFVTLTGYTREEAIGRRPVDLGLWADPGQHDAGFHEVEAHGILRDVDAEFRTKDGRLLRGTISATLVTLDAEPCVLSFVRVKGRRPRRRR